jgi:maleate isomerase
MYVCTASTLMRGRQFDLDLMRAIERETGIPCCSVTNAILHAFRHLGIRRISAVSPYPDEIDRREVAFFQSCGIEVLGMSGLGIDNGREMADPSPGEIYRFAKHNLKPGSDAMLISCGAMRAHYIAEMLEQDIGVPVVSSTTATMWAAMRFAGVMDPLPGFGRLLATAGSPEDFTQRYETD